MQDPTANGAPEWRPVTLVSWAYAPDWLTVDQAAELTRLDADTLQEWISEGCIDARQDAGGQWAIRKHSLKDFLELLAETPMDQKAIRWETLPDWISVEEAAAIAGYSINHVRSLARRGKIIAERKGPMYWIDRGSWRSYLAEVDSLGTQRFNWRRQKQDQEDNGE